MAKNKSLLDDVLISARNTISNFTSGAQKTISPIIKNASDMTQTFANDYNDWNKNNRIKLQQQQNQQREQSRQATTEILNRGSQAVNTVKNIAMKNVITPIAQSPIKDTYVGKFGEYAGKALALPSIEAQMNKSNKEMSSQIPLLLKKANQPGISPDQKRRLLTVAGNLAKQSGKNAEWLQEEYKATPLDIAKAGLGTYGTLTEPGQVVAGGVLGGGMKAVENVVTGKPIDKDITKAGTEGANFAALLAPLAKVTGFGLKPLTSKFAPVEIKNINQYINLAKNATEPSIRNQFIRLAAKRVVQNLGKEFLTGSTAFGAYGALEPAKDLEERVHNIIDNAIQGGAFNVGLKSLGLGTQAAVEQIPAVNKALGQKGFFKFGPGEKQPTTREEYINQFKQKMDAEIKDFTANGDKMKLPDKNGDAFNQKKQLLTEYQKNPDAFIEKYNVVPGELPSSSTAPSAKTPVTYEDIADANAKTVTNDTVTTGGPAPRQTGEINVNNLDLTDAQQPLSDIGKAIDTTKKGIVQAGNTYADLHGVSPDSTITVYRGVKSSYYKPLAGGEWVTQDKQLANLYARNRARTGGESAKIISQKVKASDLVIDPSTNPGVENEFRYNPSSPQQPLGDIRKKIRNDNIGDFKGREEYLYKGKYGGPTPEFNLKFKDLNNGNLSYQLIDKNGSKLGHIVGNEAYAYSDGIKGDVFNMTNTHMFEGRGSGAYQKAVQEVANNYEGGLITRKFQASEALQKSLRKIPGVIETDKIFHIPNSKISKPLNPQYVKSSFDNSNFSISHQNGARAFGTINGNTANVVNIDTNGIKGMHFFEGVVNTLDKKGIKTINVKLQNDQSAGVLKRLQEKGILTNPRNEMGSSGNEYYATYDISNPLTTPFTSDGTTPFTSDGNIAPKGYGIVTNPDVANPSSPQQPLGGVNAVSTVHTNPTEQQISPKTPVTYEDINTPKAEIPVEQDPVAMIQEDMKKAIAKEEPVAKTKTPGGNPVVKKEDNKQNNSGGFTPSQDWQEVPAGTAVPPGGEFKLDMESGKSFARWPKSIAKKNEKIIQQDKGLAGPVGPDDVITNPDDPFYNIERMNIPNEAKVIIKQEVTGDLKPKIEEMVGKTLTDKEIVDLAKVSSDDLIKAIGREDTAKFAAAQERLREKIAFLAQETAQGKPITKDFLESIIADKTFAANTARLLQKRGIDIEPNSPPSRVMVKMMKDILEVTDDLDKVLAAAKNVNWDDVASTTKFYRTFVRPTAGDWVDKLRYGSMLSSINTHIINVTSNWQGAMMLAPINKTINGIVDGVASAVTLGKHKQTQFPGEGVAFAKAAYTVGIKRAFKNMIDSLKGKTMDMNPDMRFTPLTTAGHPITSKEGALHVIEKALDVPGKALEAEDQFFIAMTKAGLENAMKYRQGKGIKMNNLTNDIERETDRILFRAPLNRTGEGLIGDAILGGGQQIQNWTYAKNPIIRWMAKMSFPFVRVGSNLAVEASQAIPGVSMINMAGKENKVEGVTKMMLGSLVTLIGTSMAVSDKMKAWEPTDPKKKAAFRKAGYLPWSMELGGKSVQFTKMHPSIGVPLGMVAALDQARRDKKLDEDTAAKIMYGVAGSLKYFADQTYVKNLGDFTNLFGGDENALTQLASNYPSQFIPYRAFGGWITKIIDEYQRAPDKESPTLVKLMQTVAAGLPVASYSVPIKKTDAGVPLKNTNRLTNAISPYKIKDIDPTGAQDYQDLLTRAEQNKLIKMRSDLDSKALDAYDLRSPEEVENANRIKIKQEIEKNNIKLNNTTGGVSGGDTINVTPEKDTLSPDNVYNYWDSETQTVKTIDLNKFNEKSQGIAKYAQDNKKYTMARQIHDAQLTQEEKDKAYKTLGVTREDVRYDYLANQTTDVSVKYLLEKLTDQPHEIVLERLITGRENSISGPQFVTDEILNKLEDEGLISGDEAKALKQIKYNKSGNLIGLGVGGKGKKISLDANTTKPRAGGASFKLSGPSSSGSSKASSGIKLKQLKITPPKGATFASTYKPSVITPKLRQGTFSLKGLGKA